MRIYLQGKERLMKFNLPAKVDGSLLFSFYSNNDLEEKFINIDAINEQWVLKSNENIKILNSLNSYEDEIILKNYMCIPIYDIALDEIIYIFCLPSVEDNKYLYKFNDLKEITIGRDNDNNIVYHQNMTSSHHAKIELRDNGWYLTLISNDKNKFVYVNNQRINESSKLSTGDLIFMNGLRIIWMQDLIIIPMNNRLFSTNVLLLSEMNDELDNTKFTPTTDYEKKLTLYNENEYYLHTPRIRSILETQKIRVDAPPQKQDQEQELPFLLSIGSSFTMLGMSFYSAFNLYNTLYSGERDVIDVLPQIVMLSTMLVGSLLIPLITKRFQKKLAKQKERKRQIKYGNYLKRKEDEIIAKQRNQMQIIFNNNISWKDCINILNNRSRILWNRVIKDDDFLEVRIGIGARKSLIEIECPEDKFTLDDDNLYNHVVKLGKKYDMLENVPISISFKEKIVTPIIIQNNKKKEFLDQIMLQIMALHSPIDLKIAVFTDKVNSEMWDYLKYTGYNWSNDFTIRYFASNQDEYKYLSQELETEFSKRKEEKKAKEIESESLNKEKYEEHELYDSYYLIITDSFRIVRKYKFFTDLLDNQYNFGFSLIIIDKDMKNIPNEATKFLVIDDNESGMFDGKVTNESTTKFEAEFVSNINMRDVAKIVGNIPIKGVDAEYQLPSVLSFLEMYNVGKIEQLNIRNRWKTSDPISSLKAPIGVHTNGELFYLDLHEKFDGPHGLIAGSTGSGKSEFIITYILSMAINYDPKEVQFVLIDYKGGGLAGAFENKEKQIAIPHLAGTITNLDTLEMNRTLVSINSELKRRQVMFNKVKEQTGESTMDIYKYQRLYREGVIDKPISHLFIVSDEFAELKSQQPEFMTELVSTARIGRSLGVHLILATQKPSGVVNDQIWSNSKFKVCLKVATKSDSMEMLKRPDAASLRETGRFYLQIGYDEYFDIGQSAWSGDKYVPMEKLVKTIDDDVIFVNNTGEVLKKSFKVPKKVNTIDYGDQLTNIVKMVSNIAIEDKIITNKLWLPSLNKNIILSELLKKYNYNNENKVLSVEAIIGEYDAPEKQEQGLLKLDLLNEGNTLIYGTSGSGKDNIIFTIVSYLSGVLSPNELNIYIGDFGAETLKLLNKIPQVGDAFVTQESEKLFKLVEMLNKILEDRKKRYSEFGGNYIEYCKYSNKKDPFTIVALNNFENFVESYSRFSDIFNSLFRDGFKYGIVFVVTTVQKNIIRSSISQYFPYKICLNMPNNSDYRDLLGSPKKLIPADNYGRGIASLVGKYVYEFQTANICPREEKTPFIKKYSDELISKYKNQKAKPIPTLPEIVTIKDVLFEQKGLECVPIGIEKNSLEVYVYNFVEHNINLIAAKQIKNHIYFIYALIKEMSIIKNVKLHILDAQSIYRGNYENIDLYQDDFERVFLNMYQNVQNDNKLEEKHVYFILGVAEFKQKVSKYNKYFELLFKSVKNCKNNIFLYFDDTEGYKKIQTDSWFRDNINNTYGIWLGDSIAEQVALGVMSLTNEDKKNIFPCIGYPIYSGRHMVIKYVVDGVDDKNEQ